LEVITMLALTDTQWNWIFSGGAVFLLALMLLASALWGWRDAREAKKRSRHVGAVSPPKHEDEESRKAA
jgi:hypothetical protein